MGTGAEVAVPLIISALGTGAAAYNTDRVNSRQDDIAAQGIRTQAGHQREADARVDSELDRLKGSTAEGERKQSADQFMSLLQRSRAQAQGSTPAVAGASGAYGADVAAGNAQADATGAQVADLMARIGAPGMQRQREGQGVSRMATDVGMIGRQAAGSDFLHRLRISATRRNPWIDAGASGAQAYAGAMAGSGTAGDDGTLYSVMDNGSMFSTPRPMLKGYGG